MAFSMLQDVGGISGLPDIGVDDTSVDDSGDSSGGITSALETSLLNLGTNVAAGAASVGLNAFAKSTGTAPVVAPYSAGTLARAPGTVPYASSVPLSQSLGGNSTLIIGGVGVLFMLVLVVALARR